jgi:hypothetical protein
MDEETPSLDEVADLPIHSQADLDRLWRALVGDLGFSHRRLWVLLVCDDGRPIPHVVQVDEIPELPGDDLVHLLEMCQHLDDEAAVAVLLSRPGSDGLTATDKAWGAALLAAARATGVSCWPLHVANDVAIRVVAPDDLAA